MSKSMKTALTCACVIGALALAAIAVVQVLEFATAPKYEIIFTPKGGIYAVKRATGEVYHPVRWSAHATESDTELGTARRWDSFAGPPPHGIGFQRRSVTSCP